MPPMGQTLLRILKIICYVALGALLAGFAVLSFLGGLDICPRLDEGGISCVSPGFEVIASIAMAIVFAELLHGPADPARPRRAHLSGIRSPAAMAQVTWEIVRPPFPLTPAAAGVSTWRRTAPSPTPRRRARSRLPLCSCRRAVRVGAWG